MQDVTLFVSNHPFLSLATVVTLVLLTIIELIRAKRSTLQISPTQMTQLINHDNGTVIDIRSADAFKNGHVIDALSLSAQEVQEPNKKVEKLKSRPIIVVCETGAESQRVASRLLKNGFNAYALAGGLRNWREAQLPLVKD